MAKKSSSHHFPVGNSDMTLFKIASSVNIIMYFTGMHIRQNVGYDSDKCDVLEE